MSMPSRLAVTDGSPSVPTPFHCTRRQEGKGSSWIHLVGELDLASSQLFAQTLGEEQTWARVVSIDLRDLTFIDCSGVALIFEAAATARRMKTRLILVGGSGQVGRVLDLTGVPESAEVARLPRDEHFRASTAAA